MKKVESKILTISGLTNQEWESFHEKFGDYDKGDESRTIQVKNLNEFEVSKFNTFFGISIQDFDIFRVYFKI